MKEFKSKLPFLSNSGDSDNSDDSGEVIPEIMDMVEAPIFGELSIAGSTSKKILRVEMSPDRPGPGRYFQMVPKMHIVTQPVQEFSHGYHDDETVLRDNKRFVEEDDDMSSCASDVEVASVWSDDEEDDRTAPDHPIFAMFPLQ